MTPAELQAINDESDASDLELLEAEDEEVIAAAERYVAAKQAAAVTGVKPAATPAPAAAAPVAVVPPKPVLGLGSDGIYRLTRSQADNPLTCFETQGERAKARAILIVPE
jgi:hypothetical protein